MVAYFDGRGKKIYKLGENDVVLQGFVNDGETPVLVVPTCITAEQGFALDMLGKANFKAPPIVLTNNVQLAKWKFITAKEADNYMKENNGPQIIQQVTEANK